MFALAIKHSAVTLISSYRIRIFVITEVFEIFIYTYMFRKLDLNHLKMKYDC